MLKHSNKFAKKKTKQTPQGWNEFNTFSKLIYPYLEEKLGFPPRKSEFFDEQTWVRKRNNKSGPYDGAFKDDRGVVVLVEAKKQDKQIGPTEINQAFDYCLGDTFPVPPPYVLISNGLTNIWFRRNKSSKGEYNYGPCDEVNWTKAKKESGAGHLTEQLTLKELIRLLSKLRKIIYQDLIESYFPEKFSLKKNNLGARKKGFEEVLNTRKTFVDAALADAEEKKAIPFVLSSIALSITLKILFIKITTDRRSEIFPKKLKEKIGSLSRIYPGILIANPYDVLDISKQCESQVVQLLKPICILQGLMFETNDNPIGNIWDGLVETEEQDLQVQSLGNVYTPDTIVKAMVTSAEKSISNWRNKFILEPSCGSGHFFREIYKRLRDTYLSSETGARVAPARAHLMAMDHICALDIDPFAVQTTQLGMFLELYREQEVWRKLAPNDRFDFSQFVYRRDYLEPKENPLPPGFKPDLIIGNPPYGISVTQTVADYYSLQNNDSYGCFIVNSLRLLVPDGILSFVVSNTFLTTRTHLQLRNILLEHSNPQKIMQLHRNAFPSRDVFACLIESKKCNKRNIAEINIDQTYRYYDAWPIHPNSSQFAIALQAWSDSQTAPLEDILFKKYVIPLGLLVRRIQPPRIKDEDDSNEGMDNEIKDIKAYGRDLVHSCEVISPFVGGNSWLMLLASDLPYEENVMETQIEFPHVGNIQCLKVKNRDRSVNVVKLWQICKVAQGLATADDERFLRKTPGVIPNSRRKNIKDVDPRLTLHGPSLEGIEDSKKLGGIATVDRENDKYFVPFDKGGESDTAMGELTSFFAPIDYWIDWSRSSVNTLKARNKWKPGTAKKPRLQNTRYYFRPGIVGSFAGIYSPSYRLSYGGVFCHSANFISPYTPEITNYVLVVLCSRVLRYFARNLICTTVNFTTDYFKQLPIPVPNIDQIEEANKICQQAIERKRSGVPGATAVIDKLVDPFVHKLFTLEELEISEVNAWFKRRYPHLGRSS